MSEYTVCGYDMDILHARMLEIASEVDRICREQHITYSLYGGSVIGAVRHNGFIPWDHDIDIALPRKDYERLKAYFRTNPSEKLFFSHYDSEPMYPNNWGKMRLNGTRFVEKELKELPLHHGVFIDVHPIDNIVPCLLKTQVHAASFWASVHRVKCGVYHGKAVKRQLYRLFSWMPYRVINFLRDASMKWFSAFPTKYVYKVAHPNNGVYPILRETFEDLIEHPFEDKLFFIPRRYDEFLRERYGDYMKIPPESEIKECCTTIVECQL